MSYLRIAMAFLLLLARLGHGEKTVLIAGGAGFLGSNLCDKIIGSGHKVICIDNLSSGSFRNIVHLMDHPLFNLIIQDISEPLLIFDPIDEIFNLACPASPEFYQKNPIQTLKTNFLGMMNILELAKEKQAKVLQASTSEVYGDPDIHPQHENYWGNVNPYGCRSCYDEGKRVAEALCYAYRRMHGVDVKIVRIFNTFGPRMDPKDGRVVSNFIVQALSNLPLTIYGNGSQTRSLCYVDDLLNGFYKVIKMPFEFEGPVNLGNPSSEMTVFDIAQIVIELTNSDSEITFKSLPHDDPKRRQPDISMAVNELEWEPQISIKEGLQRMIEYYIEELKPIQNLQE